MLKVFISLFLLLPFVCSANTAEKIKALLSTYGAHAGISVRGPGGQELLEVQGGKAFTPASVAKLVSSLCAFETLGPDHQFETKWGYQGEIVGEILKGNLVVQGSGDASFVFEDLKAMMERIRYVHGIKKIEGSLIFDTQAFKQPVFHAYEGFDGDKGRAFRAPLSAVPLNHNSFAIWIAPGPKPKVAILPRFAMDVKITNQLKTAQGRFRGSRMNLDYRPDQKIVILKGVVGNNDTERAYYRSVHNPYESFARIFSFNFQILGGEWGGQYQVLQNVPNVNWIITHRSRSLSRLYIDINKLSTNFGAELTMMGAARKSMGRAVGPEDSRNFISQCVASMGVKPEGIKLDNASGLSRGAKIEPSALTQLLSEAVSRDYYPEYLSSLSVVGVDGTTRSRLKKKAGKARLKTGRIDGVRGIAGYVSLGGGMLHSVAMFLNCKTCDSGKWQRIEDAVLGLLIEEGM